jgi:NhaA family Na+:H+ antiporter
VFALANADVVLKAGSFGAPGANAVFAGVVIGLVAGKAVGISAASWLAARVRIARLPEDATPSQLVGIAGVAGIGFTVSLFVAELAFPAGPLQDAAKLGVLAASTVAAVVGGIVLRWAGRARPRPV